MVELNYDVKSVRELQGTLVGVGIFANLIGFSALFLIPASISSQSPSGIVIRYLGGILGVTGGGISLGVGVKLDSLKPLEFAATKVEDDLKLREFAFAQLLEQKRLEVSTQEQIKGLFPQPEPKTEPLEVQTESKTEPELGSEPLNPDEVKGSEPNSTPPEPRSEPIEPKPEPSTEPYPNPGSEVVECEVEEVSEFSKDVLWDKDIFQDEVEVFSRLWNEYKITNKLELIQIFWGRDIKKGGSKNYLQASERIGLIAQYSGIDTGWGNATTTG